MQSACAMLSPVVCLVLPNFFHITSQTAQISKKKKTLLNTKRVFWFSVQISSQLFLILRRIQRNIIINVYRGLHVKYQFFLSVFNQTYIFPTDIRKMLNCFMWMDGQAATTKLRVSLFAILRKATIKQPTHKFCVDWIQLALDRTRRPAIVNMVTRNASTSWGTMNVLRNSLHHAVRCIKWLYFFYFILALLGGPWWHSGYGAVLQIGRSLVRFRMVSLEFFIDTILPIALWPWGRLSL